MERSREDGPFGWKTSVCGRGTLVIGGRPCRSLDVVRNQKCAESVSAQHAPRGVLRGVALAGVRDEDVAAELERSAGRAQMRGSLAASAAFLERAAGLTVDPERRAQRALAAAQAKHQAGAAEAALALLASAQAGPLDRIQRAQGEVL